MKAFMHGMVLAVSLIIPLGVQNLFVFNQGVIQRQFARALPVVVAASLCDTLLIVLAVQGVSLVVLSFVLFKTVLLAAGVLFLLYMGRLTWRNSAVANDDGATTQFTAKRQVIFAVTVSLLNPHAVMDTVGVIGISALNYAGSDKTLFMLACIAVSWAWFFLLAFCGRLLGSTAKFSVYMFWFNRLSAILMWLAALYMLSMLVW